MNMNKHKHFSEKIIRFVVRRFIAICGERHGTCNELHYYEPSLAKLQSHFLNSLRKNMAIRSLYLVVCFVIFGVEGCGGGIPSALELPAGDRGYVLHAFAKRTEVMIDFCKKDGISRGTRLDVFKMDVPDMNEPVKIAEITVEDVGRKMSKARVTAFTSSLRMKPGDRVFPHPVIIVTDASWFTSRRVIEGWKSDTALPDERSWQTCKTISHRRIGMEPEMRQLIADTDVKPVWHPSLKSHRGDVFFRKVFLLDASVATATLSVACGGRTNVYLNDIWVGKAEEWPEISDFKVRSLLKRGKNLVAVYTVKEPRTKAPSALFLALTVKTQFK